MINWEQIQTEYITTNIGYKKLSDKYGVSYSTLNKRALAEKWSDKKRRFKEKTVADAVSKTSRKEAAKLVSLKQAADSMGAVIAKVFEDTQQFNRYLVKTKLKGCLADEDGDGQRVEKEEVEERIFNKYDTKAIRDMTASIKDLATAVRNLYGILTEPERSALDITAARLELDRKKAEAGGGDDGESGVVMIADVPPDDGGGGGENG